MTRRETWRLAIIAASIAGACYTLYPTYQLYSKGSGTPGKDEVDKGRILNLGLDLRGGIHLLLEVNPGQLSPAEREDVVDRVAEIIANRTYKREEISNAYSQLQTGAVICAR